MLEAFSFWAILQPSFACLFFCVFSLTPSNVSAKKTFSISQKQHLESEFRIKWICLRYRREMSVCGPWEEPLLHHNHNIMDQIKSFVVDRVSQVGLSQWLRAGCGVRLGFQVWGGLLLPQLQHMAVPDPKEPLLLPCFRICSVSCPQSQPVANGTCSSKSFCQPSQGSWS